MKKLIALALVATMLLGMTSIAFADEREPYRISNDEREPYSNDEREPY